MNTRLPPIPGSNLQTWAMHLYDYLSSQAGVSGQVEPTPVFLPHMVANNMARAAVEGILLYDPVTQSVVVSKNGAWEPVGNSPFGGTGGLLDMGNRLDTSAVFDGGARV